MRSYNSHKRVLVTGGAGFLGSHLCERLLADGNDVLCVDNFFTGTKDNIAHLLSDPRFELIKVARIFNTYGPRMHPNDGRVVSNFIVQALKGEPITVYGEGKQTRSFCYVNDLIAGLIRLMNSPDEFTGPANLGNPVEFTILELAKKAIALTGSKSKIVFKSLPSDDPAQRQPNIELARRVLGWEPRVPLETGLSSTIEYFRGNTVA